MTYSPVSLSEAATGLSLGERQPLLAGLFLAVPWGYPTSLMVADQATTLHGVWFMVPLMSELEKTQTPSGRADSSLLMRKPRPTEGEGSAQSHTAGVSRFLPGILPARSMLAPSLGMALCWGVCQKPHEPVRVVPRPRGRQCVRVQSVRPLGR